MSPPPPPSSFYLLDDIDTDDSQDASPTESSLTKVVAQQEQEPTTTTKKKKKRKKKRKKKAAPRGVHFGDVSVREYERCLGTDVVPLDGGWPLGISNVISAENSILSSIDDFEERRQAELRKRWTAVMSKHLNSSNDDVYCTDDLPLTPPTGDLETRQFDYRKRRNAITNSTKNPLFGPLDEDDRMRLLLSNSEEGSSVPPAPPKSSPSSSKHQHTRRTRSNSMGHHNHDHNHDSYKSGSPSSTRRLRSHSEQFYSERYPSSDVLHVRNELEQIRVHRTLEGSIGCKCRKLDVYLPPPDGGGKKAQHRRMNVHKVKEELRKRGKLPKESKTRSELEHLLHDIVEQEPCCSSEDCFCKRNGIGCQADACSCWFESHQRKGQHAHHDDDDSPSAECIRQRCGNNMYAVDLDAIHNFRLQYCQQVQDASS